jgi:integrase
MNKLQEYKIYLQNLKKSIVYYDFLKILFNYLEEKNIDFMNLSKEQLAQYFKDKNYSKNSINNVLKAGRNYCKFIDKEINCFTEIKLLGVDRKIPKYLTIDEIKKAIKYISTYNIRLDTNKVTLIIWFMFYTAVTKAEMCSLKREDFDLKNNTVRIFRTKTDKERILPFPKTLKIRIEQYFQTSIEEKNAFNITVNQIHTITGLMKNYLKKRVTPHLLRHSGCRWLVENRVSISIICKMLGHSSLETTMIYASADDLLVKRSLDELYKKKNI